MKRLRYIKTSDFTLDIDLENGYWVRTDAKYNHKSQRYDMTFYIKQNTIDKYAAIETLNNEHITFPGDRKTIKTEILRYISSLLSQNYFDNCIEHYEYEDNCFQKGHELFEEERSNLKKHPIIKWNFISEEIYCCSNCRYHLKEKFKSCPRCEEYLDWSNIQDCDEWEGGTD